MKISLYQFLPALSDLILFTQHFSARGSPHLVNLYKIPALPSKRKSPIQAYAPQRLVLVGNRTLTVVALQSSILGEIRLRFPLFGKWFSLSFSLPRKEKSDGQLLGAFEKLNYFRRCDLSLTEPLERQIANLLR